MLPSRFLPCRLAPVLLALLIAPLGWLSASPAAAEISGNSYISAQYGYTFTWDDTWFAVEEFADTFYDGVAITNGLTYVTVFGEDNVYDSLEAGMASNVRGVRSDSAVEDFEPLRGGDGEVIRGEDDVRQFAAFTYTYTYEDGTVEDLAALLEVRAPGPGNVLMSMLAVTLVDDFDEERPLFESLLDGVSFTGGPSPDSSEPVAGEPGPVFASGPWRIAVATSAMAAEFADLGLKPKADKQWLVVILDVTNWSDADTELSATRFTIALAGEAKPVKIARSSLQPVAEQLALTPFSEDFTLAIEEGETVRIVLAFVLPANAQAPQLLHREVALPLEDTIALGLAPGDLPAPALAPEITEGELVSASDGRTMRIELDGESDAERIQLLGVELQDEGECLANAAENTLDDLAGADVLVEEDAAVTGGDDEFRYVWLINDDGTRTLLNQLLLESGAARVDGIPGDARFGAWLTATAQAAESAEIGLWAGCDS